MLGARIQQVKTMKQTPKLFAAVGLVAALAGCSDDPLKVQGRVALTVRQAGQADGSTGFEFPSDTVVDAPPGVGMGIFGRCVRDGRTWVVEIDRAMPAGDQGLQRFSVRVPDRETLEAPQVSFVLGPSTFSGSGTCTITATKAGESLQVTANCAGLRATMDPRSVDAALNLTFQNCGTAE